MDKLSVTAPPLCKCSSSAEWSGIRRPSHIRAGQLVRKKNLQFTRFGRLNRGANIPVCRDYTRWYRRCLGVAILKQMDACTADFALLEAPITLADLARHLATRKDFILYPCQASALNILQLVAPAYGYDAEFHPEAECVSLRHRRSEPQCGCGIVGDHLTSWPQLRVWQP